MADTAIQVESLEKTFKDGWFGRRPIRALRKISFAVERGSIFGLLGPNGAGKTTLIKILLGLVYKSGGRATLLGQPAGDRRGRAQVGYLPEHHRIPRHLNGYGALAYYGGLSGLVPSQVRRRRDELLHRVGLGEWGGVSVRKYSKGMLQRLGLAQAILHDPELLILDEPTDGVDPVGRSELRTLLQELKSEGKTIFINSHLLQEVELVCDRVAILDQGTLMRVGTLAEITDQREREIEFGVRGPTEVLRQIFSTVDVVDWQDDTPEITKVRTRGLDQNQVNGRIDALRDQQLDLVSLTTVRDSLEDAFLEIVSRSDAPATAAETTPHPDP